MPTQSNDSKSDVAGMAEFRLVLSVPGCGDVFEPCTVRLPLDPGKGFAEATVNASMGRLTAMMTSVALIAMTKGITHFLDGDIKPGDLTTETLHTIDGLEVDDDEYRKPTGGEVTR